MDNGIDLDDVQVVNVTGVAHKDRVRTSRGRCSCNPSLRVTTIIIFIVIGAVYLVGVLIGNYVMNMSLVSLDEGACDGSIDRFTMLLYGDMIKLKQLTRHYSISPLAVDVALHSDDLEYFEGPYGYETSVLNQSQVYEIDPDTGLPTGRLLYNTGLLINYWAFLDKDTYETIWSVYYPPMKPGDLCDIIKTEPQPRIDPEFYRSIRERSGDMFGGWIKLHVPGVVQRPMIVSFEPIMMPGVTTEYENETIYGYLVCGRLLKPRLPLFADEIPSCMAMSEGPEEFKQFDKEDRDNFGEVVSGIMTDDWKYSGEAYFAQRDKKDVQNSPYRVCPQVPLFDPTDTMMVGYFKLCDQDPKKVKGASCVPIRVDRPMSMVDQGSEPVIVLSNEIIIMMVVLCVAFVVFLDCVVLRRIVNLSKVIRKQTRGHADAMKDNVEDDTAQTTSVAEDKKDPKGSRRGKKARSAGGSSEGSHTSTSSDGGEGPRGTRTTRDEIGNLKRIMEQNALGLRKRLEVVNDYIKIEQQKTSRHKQAMQLLNLWCGRKDYFPGLRPNAMQLRYEPTRSLDDLLANPLAIEYLKSHCDSERTLENLWFLLDVSWLRELEEAEDKEEDAGKRKQIHDVASAAAMTIVSRYVAVNAPQQINISAACFKSLREKAEVYQRGMFDDAVGEVKLMLNTDILPRFQKSTAYSAMSETLYVDSAGGGEESEFSDETVSTAGSILTDEGEEAEGGVARVFAHTFKNLHNNFDVGHDTDASSTYSATSSRATNALTSAAVPSISTQGATNSGVLGASSEGKATGAASSQESSRNAGSSASLSEQSDDEKDSKPKEEPVKEESEKPAPPPAAETAGSSDSSDSSSSSSESLSVSESSSSSSSSSD